jgi:hypothetical protein
MRCLDKSPATRVASMRELEAGLAPFAGVDSVPRLVADGAPSTVSGSNDASEIRAVSRGERTSLAPRIAAALALIGALGLGAAWAYGGSTSAPSDETRVAPPPTIATTPAPSVVPVTTVVAIEAPPTSVAPIAMHRRIESDPTGATVLRNGEVVGTTPLDLALPDGAPIEITLRAPGRRTTTRTIGPDDPPVVSVHLDLARRAPSLPVLAPH